MFKTHTLFLFIFLTSLLLCSCSQLKQNVSNGKAFVSPPNVEVFKIGENNFIKELKAIGTLQSPQSTELTSEKEGKIIYLNIPEGQFVNRGHILARVNDVTNQAEIEVVKAKLENAETNYNRMKALRDKGAISAQTLDNSFEIVRVAQGEYNRVTSVSSMTQVIAPFNGVLSIRKVSLGEYIDPGNPIVRISQIDPIDLILSLPEEYISQVKVGQDVKFIIDGKKHIAKITVIDPYIDPDTRTVQIKAQAQNPKRELLPGRFANVILEVQNIKNAILIPEEALIQEQEDNKKQVAIVLNNNTVAFKEVSVAKWGKGSILISSGLMEGDVIITSGHQKVKAGSKVNPSSFKKIHNKLLDKDAPE